ncbi:hypothetical protein ACOMHN_049140 [Nucella lapillus]
MGWKDCVHRVSDSLRSIPFRPRQGDEHLQFAKFSHAESERELHVLQNGSVQPSMPTDTSGCSSSDSDEWERFRYADEVSDPDNYGNPRERISEWQAGWNVTNAIQGIVKCEMDHSVCHKGIVKCEMDHSLCHKGIVKCEMDYSVCHKGIVKCEMDHSVCHKGIVKCEMDHTDRRAVFSYFFVASIISTLSYFAPFC